MCMTKKNNKPMKKQALGMVIILFTFSVLATSCGKKHHLEIQKDRIAFNYLGGTDVFSVKADCSWNIQYDGETGWFTLSQEEGEQGSTVIEVNAERNTSGHDREAWLTVRSSDGKVKKDIPVVQNWVDISLIEQKLWFLRYYTRWDKDYYNHLIPESWHEYYYYTEEDMHNWYLYFADDTIGYQVHIYPKDTEGKRDTIYHPFEYLYFPVGDSLIISFETVSDSLTEDYHATINELNNEYFNFTNEYLWHRFERLDMVNLSNERAKLNIRPEKVVKKAGKGPLIDID